MNDRQRNSSTQDVTITLTSLIVDARHLKFNSEKVQWVAINGDSESLIRDTSLCSKSSIQFLKDSVSAINSVCR